MKSEIELITKYFLPLSDNKESLELKNDAALIKKSGSSYVISSDMMIEDVHFKIKDCPKLLGKKILRVNLSDVAAMGAKPFGYILNVSIPESKTKYWLERFCEGLKEDQSFFKIKLFGGDFCSSKKIFLSITILGKVKNKVHKLDSADKSSEIYVSGFIGDSIMGFLIKNDPNFFSFRNQISKKSIRYLYKTHLLPRPRIDLGIALLKFTDCCTDISDGLLMDLNKVCNLSGLKGNIFLENIPLSDPLKKILTSYKDKNKLWNFVLTGGEDYELLFSVKKKYKRSNSFKKLIKKYSLTKIGFFSKGKGLDVFDEKKKKMNFKKIGFSHF